MLLSLLNCQLHDLLLSSVWLLFVIFKLVFRLWYSAKYMRRLQIGWQHARIMSVHWQVDRPKGYNMHWWKYITDWYFLLIVWTISLNHKEQINWYLTRASITYALLITTAPSCTTALSNTTSITSVIIDFTRLTERSTCLSIRLLHSYNIGIV